MKIVILAAAVLLLQSVKASPPPCKVYEDEKNDDCEWLVCYEEQCDNVGCNDAKTCKNHYCEDVSGSYSSGWKCYGEPEPSSDDWIFETFEVDFENLLDDCSGYGRRRDLQGIAVTPKQKLGLEKALLEYFGELEECGEKSDIETVAVTFLELEIMQDCTDEGNFIDRQLQGRRQRSKGRFNRARRANARRSDNRNRGDGLGRLLAPKCPGANLVKSLRKQGFDTVAKADVGEFEEKQCDERNACRGTDGDFACCGVEGCQCKEVSKSLCEVFGCNISNRCEKYDICDEEDITYSGRNGFCRADLVGYMGGKDDPKAQGYSNQYFDRYDNIGSLQACEDMCTNDPSCTGVEYSKYPTKYCELWQVPIVSIKPATGPNSSKHFCHSKGNTAPPESTGNGVTEVSWDKHNDQLCQIHGGDAKEGIDFKTRFGKSFGWCKDKCKATAGCKAFDHRARDDRCKNFFTFPTELRYKRDARCWKKK